MLAIGGIFAFWTILHQHVVHFSTEVDSFVGIKTFAFCASRWFAAKSDKSGQDMEHLDFKIVVEPKDSQSFTVILVASSRQEKSAWTSDISQARQPRLTSSTRESEDATELTNVSTPCPLFFYRR